MFLSLHPLELVGGLVLDLIELDDLHISGGRGLCFADDHKGGEDREKRYRIDDLGHGGAAAAATQLTALC